METRSTFNIADIEEKYKNIMSRIDKKGGRSNKENHEGGGAPTLGDVNAAHSLLED